MVGVLAGCEGYQPPGSLCWDDAWCDGNVVTTCATICQPGGHDCERVYTAGVDCARTLPEAKACIMLPASNGLEYPGCFERNPEPCTAPGELECSSEGPAMARLCTETLDGWFWDNSIHCLDGNVCRNHAISGVICHPPDAASCPAGTPSYCSDATTLVNCLGNPTDGYVLVPRACATACSVTGSDIQCDS